MGEPQRTISGTPTSTPNHRWALSRAASANEALAGSVITVTGAPVEPPVDIALAPGTPARGWRSSAWRRMSSFLRDGSRERSSNDVICAGRTSCSANTRR